MPPIGSTNQLATLGKGLGYSPGGAPANVLGYRQSPGAPPAPSSSSYDAGRAEFEALLKSIRESGTMSNQVAIAPSYDVLGAHTRARQQAESNVAPIYQEKMNNLIQRIQAKRDMEKGVFSRTKAATEAALADTLTGTGIERIRTQEDTETGLAEVANNETAFQDVEGTSYDTARREEAQALAGAGLATSGLGAQKQDASLKSRNIESGQQTRTFEQKRQGIGKFLSRTFEDLNRTDTISKRKATQDIDLADFSLKGALAELDLEQREETMDLELKKGTDVITRSQDIYKTNLQNWVESLREGPQKQAARQAYY